jgi:membrane protease YdiL (CAAX protease family)
MPHPPPPDPPERPEGISSFPRWPAWYAPAAFGMGFFVLVIIGGIAGAIAGGKLSTGAGLILTVPLEIAFVGVAIFFASRTERPRPAHFGLRRAPFWRTVGWAALGWGSFFVVSAVYGLLVKPHDKQPLLTDIRSESDTLLIVGFAVLAIVCAPIAEEFFFRGFFYRALRSRFSVVVAALIDGVVFGLIHYDSPKSLVSLPVLAVLGFVFCLVYEKTGTLYSTIALHALNNTLAVGVTTHDWGLALGLGGAMLTACVVLPTVVGTGGAPRPAARAPARA